jgi:hypothetical protein
MALNFWRLWLRFGTLGIIMARALLWFTALLLLAGCAHLSDADIRKNLPGAWHVVLPSLNERGIKMIYKIAPNGDFTRETSMINEGVHGIDMAGTFRIQDGYLIQIVTYMRVRRKAHLPQVLRAKIIHADDGEMVVVFDGMTEKDTLRKDTR